MVLRDVASGRVWWVRWAAAGVHLGLLAGLSAIVVQAVVRHGGLGLGLALPALLVLAWSVEATLGRRRADPGPFAVPIRADDAPALLLHLRALAERSGAPVPVRVWLVPGVEARAISDRSWLDPLVAPDEELVLGAALLAVARVDDLELWLCHEHGPFGWRAAVARGRERRVRDALDQFADHRGFVDGVPRGLAESPSRLAFVGAVLWAPIVAARVVLDAARSAVHAADHRAGRPGPPQSSALLHVFPKLRAAEDAWRRALALATELAQRGRPTDDLVGTFHRVRRHRARALGEVLEEHEVDGVEVPARPAAVLTAALVPTDVPRVQIGEDVDRCWSAPYLHPRHRGRYLDGAAVRRARHAADLVGPIPDLDRRSAQVALDEAADGDELAERTAHRAAARVLGRGHEAYLEGLLGTLHVVEHARAELSDLRSLLDHLRVADPERARSVAAQARIVLHRVHDLELVLPVPVVPAPTLLKDRLPERPMLPAPDGDLEPWSRVFEAWIGSTVDALRDLSRATLAALVRHEGLVAAALREDLDPGPAPLPAMVPRRFPRLSPGEERRRTEARSALSQVWSSPGPGGALVRVVGAAVMLVGVAALPAALGLPTTVTVHNGLGVPVVARVGGSSTTVPAAGVATLSLRRGRWTAEARTADGELVETFPVDLDEVGDAVWNVAGAAVLTERTVVFGPGAAVPGRVVGAPRFVSSTWDWPDGVAPERVEVDRFLDTAARTVLRAQGAPTPAALAALPSDQRVGLIAAHLRFDPADRLEPWITVTDPASLGLLDLRADAVAHRGALGAFAQEVAARAGDPSVCEAHRRSAAADPEDLELARLAARCLPAPERAAALLALHAEHPEHPELAVDIALVAAREGRWDAVFEAASLGGDRWLASRAARRLGAPGVEVDDPALARVLAVEASPAGVDRAVEASPELGPWLWLAAGVVDGRGVEGLSPDAGSELVPLFAASVGAGPELADVSRALEEEVESWPAIVAVASLALREGRQPPARVVEALRRSRDGERLVALLDPEALRRPGWLDEQLAGAEPVTLGVGRTIGCVALGPESPLGWCAEASALLFPWERPFLGRSP